MTLSSVLVPSVAAVLMTSSAVMAAAPVAVSRDTVAPVNSVTGEGVARQAQHGVVAFIGRYTTIEVWLSLLVILFAGFTLMLVFRLLRNNSPTPDAVLRVIVVTVIVFGALFCITAGFEPEQIAPATGLFGTIAGYLLGRDARIHRESERGGS